MNRVSFSAIVASCLAVGLVQAVDPPLQKEGLWSLHTLSVDNPGEVKSETTRTICRSHEYDKYAQNAARNLQGCKVVNESLSDGKLSIEMECNAGGSVIKSQGTTTFQGDTAFHSETHATYDPPLYGKTETTLTMDQKYIGACPAGVKPGDITGPDGKVINSWKR